jgi:glycosyltransferase involved in cell wall biosynthesis
MTSSTSSRDPISFLLVTHSYPPVMGGSENEAQRVCTELMKRGHRVTVLCAGGGPMPRVTRWVDPCGVPVRIFGGRWPGRWRDRAFALGVAWTIFSERRNYQLVYFLMQGLHLAAGLPVARLLGKPVIMKFSASTIIPMLTKSWLGRLELRWLREWARRIMILNPGMEEEALSAGFTKRQLLWMPNPVDIERFVPASTEQRRSLRVILGVPSNAQIALFVGRLDPQKNLPSLIRSFARVAGQVPGGLLVLVGDGPDRDDLSVLAGNLGLGAKVRFTGRLAETGVLQWLQASDIFVMVSHFEGLPCSLIEAMSTGLPSVVSDIPANTQLIGHEIHGLVAGLGDEQATGRAMVRLLGDASLRARMGQAARARVVATYPTEEVASRYEALFDEILG